MAIALKSKLGLHLGAKDADAVPGSYDLVHEFMRGDISPQEYAARTMRVAEERSGVRRWPDLLPHRHS